MIRRMCLFILLFRTAISLACSAQETFLQANLLCEQGKFVDAQHLYEQIEPKSALIWYNLGNSCFYNQNLSQAIWAWLQAAKSGHGLVVERSILNIDAVTNQLGLKALNFWLIKLFGIYLPDSILFWQTIGLLLIYLTCLGCVVYRSKISVILIAFMCGLFLALLFLAETESKKLYAVVKNPAIILVGPASDFHVVGQVITGEVFEVMDQLEEWYYVGNGRNKQGWLNQKDLLVTSEARF